MANKNINLKKSILAIEIILAIVIGIAFINNTFFNEKNTKTISNSTIEQRIKPIGKIHLAVNQKDNSENNISSVNQKERNGTSIYNKYCVSCHSIGIAGAPKTNDKNDWSTRLTQGIDNLVKSAITGKGAMPPKGTCGDCSDSELKSAIVYMSK